MLATAELNVLCVVYLFNSNIRLSDVECRYDQLQKELQMQIHANQQRAQQMSEVGPANCMCSMHTMTMYCKFSVINAA